MALTILDGGMGSELSALGANDGKGLWSARALLEAPELVADVHRGFIAAGADVITTNTYSTVPSYLAKNGLEDRYLELTENAARLARTVADAAERPVRVAGALPPLDESYRHDLVPDEDVAMPVYMALARTLEPFVDLFLCETMSCVREAVMAATAAAEIGTRPVWVAVTLDERPGRGLRSGESLAELCAALADVPVDALLCNCTTPAATLAALPELARLTELTLGAYPNLLLIPEGWTLDNNRPAGRAELSVADYLAFARECRAAGATIIGGCCGIGPAYIRALADDG